MEMEPWKQRLSITHMTQILNAVHTYIDSLSRVPAHRSTRSTEHTADHAHTTRIDKAREIFLFQIAQHRDPLHRNVK